MIIIILLSFLFLTNIEAGWRENGSQVPNGWTYEKSLLYQCDNLDNLAPGDEGKENDCKKRVPSRLFTNIEIYNNNHLNNHSSATASASTPQALSSPEIKPLEQSESHIKVSLFDCVKHNLAAIFAGAASAAGIIYWIKIKYHFYSLLRRCGEVEKWSKWKNLNLLKSLVSSKKFENTLVFELEQQYVMHDDQLNAFFIDVDRELQELEKLLKECAAAKDSIVTRFFVPIDQYMQDAEHKREVLNYLKKMVHEILNDFECETLDNGCAEFFLFD